MLQFGPCRRGISRDMCLGKRSHKKFPKSIKLEVDMSEMPDDFLDSLDADKKIIPLKRNDKVLLEQLGKVSLTSSNSPA